MRRLGSLCAALALVATFATPALAGQMSFTGTACTSGTNAVFTLKWSSNVPAASFKVQGSVGQDGPWTPYLPATKAPKGQTTTTIVVPMTFFTDAGYVWAGVGAYNRWGTVIMFASSPQQERWTEWRVSSLTACPG